ncbi:YggS family pyridoxal phosphate-dependent enzyme [Mycolicibacterium sp. GF69]|uniref:YggS family pyridoxal phosphate-dependent enzyme n=1 Tax=Mycolicibacterium sp. GF69 TaxID=2267251 RepID=UPI000DCF39E7|nr:YggS family pyridoxal phosphate-dependent enzyme [Mycolicibacterium sp. GF69]RAV16193.1 YggS family pyridoxal phosphate-dependent enzyme [Mycolicibacterium sp. GF69]
MSVAVPSDRERELTESLSAVRARLTAAAEAAGRDSREIELLPVTKFFPPDDVIILSRLGCEAFGESREQEASNKAREIASIAGVAPIRWHMVGRIQRNKARSVAGWAYAAHSVDSHRLIEALSRASSDALDDGRRAEPLRVFIQLSLDGDESRGGADIHRTNHVDDLCAAAHAAAGLAFAGLMAIPPRGDDADAAFARLSAEHQRIQAGYRQRLQLSAGMSDDLESAVKHGSTCVRVGTALLGQRPLPSPEVVTPVTSSSQTPKSRA